MQPTKFTERFPDKMAIDAVNQRPNARYRLSTSSMRNYGSLLRWVLYDRGVTHTHTLGRPKQLEKWPPPRAMTSCKTIPEYPMEETCGRN